MANILVVGGAGYIGSHTVNHIFHDTSHQVVVYDDLSKGHVEAVRAISKTIPLEQGDLGDYNAVRRVLAHYQIDVVMHFAAFIEVGTSVADPATYYENNFIKVQRLLAAMRDQGVEYFVFSSTAATFGQPQAEKIDEQHPQQPINPYGRSKLMVEWLLRDYAHAYGLKSVILRYFNACGADEGGVIGQSYQPATHLISIVLETALGIREKVEIYGGSWDTPDGSCIRDFVHVNDLAAAHILAMKRMLERKESADYNLGAATVIRLGSHRKGQGAFGQEFYRRSGRCTRRRPGAAHCRQHKGTARTRLEAHSQPARYCGHSLELGTKQELLGCWNKHLTHRNFSRHNTPITCFFWHARRQSNTH